MQIFLHYMQNILYHTMHTVSPLINMFYHHNPTHKLRNEHFYPQRSNLISLQTEIKYLQYTTMLVRICVLGQVSGVECLIVGVGAHRGLGSRLESCPTATAQQAIHCWDTSDKTLTTFTLTYLKIKCVYSVYF